MISVFDMFSVGIGPSSSHTVGPMRAAKEFNQQLKTQDLFAKTDEVRAELFGSLGQTGKGHGTGKAVILGLLGHAPESVDASAVDGMLEEVEKTQKLLLDQVRLVKFAAKDAIVFHRRKTLPHHANGMTIHALHKGCLLYTSPSPRDRG